MNDIYWKNATPEQELLWKQCHGLIAHNTVEPLHLQFTLPGSEFLTYEAAKLYICLEAKFSFSSSAAVAANGLITTYNMADVVNGYFNNARPVWNITDTVLNYTHPTLIIKNFFFSRLAAQTYNYIMFTGYRLTIV